MHIDDLKPAALMVEPNNLRNRYRRMISYHRGYGWAALTTFREWVNFNKTSPHSYSAGQCDLWIPFITLLRNSRNYWHSNPKRRGYRYSSWLNG
jgi:hypothetical protein